MTLLLWSIATNKVILTRDAERVISRRGEQVVPLRHKAFEALRHLVENAGRLIVKGIRRDLAVVARGRPSPVCDILRWVGLPGE